MKQSDTVKKLAMAGVLTAVAVVGSLLSFPIFGSKCAPVQHMVNILAAVVLGPGWGVGIAFCASLLRNLLGLGSLMAFPGSMIGALCCGLAYMAFRKLWLDIPWVKKQVKDIGYKVLSYESKPYEKKEKKGFFHFGKK